LQTQCPVGKYIGTLFSFSSVRSEGPEELRTRIANSMAIEIDIHLPWNRDNGGE